MKRGILEIVRLTEEAGGYEREQQKLGLAKPKLPESEFDKAVSQLKLVLELEDKRKTAAARIQELEKKQGKLKKQKDDLEKDEPLELRDLPAQMRRLRGEHLQAAMDLTRAVKAKAILGEPKILGQDEWDDLTLGIPKPLSEADAKMIDGLRVRAPSSLYYVAASDEKRFSQDPQDKWPMHRSGYSTSTKEA